MSRYGSALALLAGLLFLAFPSSALADASCSAEPADPTFELVYSLRPGEKAVTSRAREKAATTLCARLQSSKIAGRVSLSDRGTIRVVLPPLPHASALQHLTGQLGTAGQLRFYDWEPNLIGSEQAVGGRPGFAPPAKTLRRLEQEWAEAGRRTSSPANLQLILAGAFPGPYGAVRLASRQAARAECRSCSASGPRFYLFDRSPAHKLMAGPVARRAELRRGAGASQHGGLVLKVPVGTMIASELPASSTGAVLKKAEPGWFALKDRAALTNADIVDPAEEQDEFGEPTVTFGFTPKGRTAFERLTRVIAIRGRVGARGHVTSAAAEALSGHFALVFDGEIKTRPIINFRLFPNGIDGQTGAQIAGGFDSRQEAHELAAILNADPLPIELALVRRRKLPG